MPKPSVGQVARRRSPLPRLGASMGCRPGRLLGDVCTAMRTGSVSPNGSSADCSPGVAIVGTSRPEAEVVLSVIEAWTPERLRQVAESLREFVGRAA